MNAAGNSALVPQREMKEKFLPMKVSPACIRDVMKHPNAYRNEGNDNLRLSAKLPTVICKNSTHLVGSFCGCGAWYCGVL